MNAVWLSLLLVFSLTSPSWAAVAFDACGTAGAASGVTTVTATITIGSGANRGIVGVFIGNTNTTGMAATINSNALTTISGADGTTTTGTTMLGLANTAQIAAGSQSVVFTWTTSQNAVANACSFSGVNQSGGFNNGTFSVGASPRSITVTSTNGDLTHTGVGDNSTSGGPTTNQTSRWTVGGWAFTAGDTGPGTGTTTHTWTAGTGGNSVFGSATNVVQATGGAAVPPMRTLMGVGQ